MVADASGAMVSVVRYSAFGESRYEFGTTPTDYLYTGQRQEAEIGLYYYVARWYDAGIGRFIQADSIVPDPGKSLGYDRYSYGFNNPVMLSDPSGHSPLLLDGQQFVETNQGSGTYNHISSTQSKFQRFHKKQRYAPWEGEKNYPDDPYHFGMSTEEILLMVWQDPLGSDTLQGGRFGEERDNNLYGTVFHMSIDARGDEGDPIYPGAGGTIVYVNNHADIPLGVSVAIEHDIFGDKFYSVYGHMVIDSVTRLSEGERVNTDAQIGEVGQTGTDNVHLHFEIRKPQNLNLDQVNPLRNFRYWGFSSPEWKEDFVDLGQIYGYSSSYARMP